MRVSPARRESSAIRIESTIFGTINVVNNNRYFIISGVQIFSLSKRLAATVASVIPEY
jgi:hypothetical protein